MLNYARQHAIEALKIPRSAVLITDGPAGVLTGEVPCQAVDLVVYLLIPGISDHLFNLEREPSVTLLAAGWVLKGEAFVILPEDAPVNLDLLNDPHAEWCVLVSVDPHQIQIRGSGAWGHVETIDLKS